MAGSGPGMGIPMSEVAQAVTGKANSVSPILGGVTNQIFALLSQGMSGSGLSSGPLSGILSSIGGLGGLFGTTGGTIPSGSLGGTMSGASLDKFRSKIIPDSELDATEQQIKANALNVRGQKNKPGRQCAGLNTAPPENIQNRINYTIKMLHIYCPSAVKLTQPDTITSAYRSPNYNTCVATTGDSGPHTQFIALDIPYTIIPLNEIRAACYKMHSEGITWGYGEYPGDQFFHIDCRGYWAAWAGNKGTHPNYVNPLDNLPNVS